MDNVILVTFENENDAYTAFKTINGKNRTDGYTVWEMAVVRNEDGTIVVPHGYKDGYDDGDDTAFGGIIGALLGVLGGPVGVLLGTGIGLAAGRAVDDKDVADDDALIEDVCSLLYEGETALAAYVSEDEDSAFDDNFTSNVTIYRWDAEEISLDVERAEAVKDLLAQQAREQMRAEKKEAREERRAARRAARKARKNS